LDMAGVVLQVRPGPSEGDALPGAIVQQDAVDELGAIVAIQPKNAEREITQATQPVATSTMLSVYRNWPASLQPQCATRSISRNPGRASVQSAKVRMVIWRLSSVPALVVLRPRRFFTCSREAFSARSTVAALM